MVYKRLFLFFLFSGFVSLLIAQAKSKEGVSVIIKNECSSIRVESYDSLLNLSVMKYEGVKKDTFFIKGNTFSILTGISFANLKKSQFGVITIPGDSVVITAKEDCSVKVNFKNRGIFYRIREKEIDKYSSPIDSTFFEKILELNKRNNYTAIIEEYKKGYQKRRNDLKSLYKDYLGSDYMNCRMKVLSLAEKYYTIYEESQTTEISDGQLNGEISAITHLINQPALIDLPYSYNIFGSLLQNISRLRPDYYNNRYWFNWVFDSLKIGALQKNILLFYLKKLRSLNEYNTLALKFLAHFDDIDSRRVIEKYRKIKFSNLDQVQTTNVLDTAFNIIDLRKILKSYKGMPVYIDLWASWCAPCIAAMPYSKKLRHKYGQRIKFIYISIDNSSEQWLSSIDKLQLKGSPNYLLSEGIFIYNENRIKITSVPRYMIIDRDGNLIDNNVEGPGNESLIPILERLISK